MTRPTHPNALYVVAITSPKVAAVAGSSRSWNTTTFGPGVSASCRTCLSSPLYTSPARGAAPARNVAVTAYPTIGGRCG